MKQWTVLIYKLCCFTTETKLSIDPNMDGAPQCKSDKHDFQKKFQTTQAEVRSFKYMMFLCFFRELLAARKLFYFQGRIDRSVFDILNVFGTLYSMFDVKILKNELNMVIIVWRD